MALVDVYRQAKSGVQNIENSRSAPPTIGRFLGMNSLAVLGGYAASELEPMIRSWVVKGTLTERFSEDTLLAGAGAALAYGLDWAAGTGKVVPAVNINLRTYRGAIQQFIAGWMGWFGTELVAGVKEGYHAASDWLHSHTSNANADLDEAPSIDGNPAMMKEMIASLANSPESLEQLAGKLSQAVAQATGAKAADVKKGITEGFGQLAQAFA